MNPFCEVLAEVLAERAGLDVDELRTAMSTTDDTEPPSPQLIPALSEALDLSDWEEKRLIFTYFLQREPDDSLRA